MRELTCHVIDILVIDVVAFMAFTKQEFSCDTRSINTENVITGIAISNFQRHYFLLYVDSACTGSHFYTFNACC